MAVGVAVGVGLGVSNGDQAAQVAAYADAVIVGSAFVRRLLDAPTPAALRGRAAIANARLAYQHYKHAFSGPRCPAFVA